MSFLDRKGTAPERCPRSEIADKECQYDEKFEDTSFVMDWGNVLTCNWQEGSFLLAHLRGHPCQQYASWIKQPSSVGTNTE